MFNIDEENTRILVDIPLTTPSGKIRIKSRSMFYEYGNPHAAGSVPMAQNNYIEWQIGYDVETKDKKSQACLMSLLLPIMVRQKRFMSYQNIYIISTLGI